MIIIQKISFVFKPKAFWMLHLNDNLYSKHCVFLWVANFRALTVDLLFVYRPVDRPDHIYTNLGNCYQRTII